MKRLLMVKTTDDFRHDTEPGRDAVLIRRIRPDPSKTKPRSTGERKKRVQHEAKEQAALIRWALLMERSIPALKNLFAIPNGGTRRPREAMHLKASGVKPGTFDLMLPVVIRDRGVITKPGLFIEMKWGDGRPSTDQQDFKNRMVAQGYSCWICWTWTDAAAVILDYLGPEFARFKSSIV